MCECCSLHFSALHFKSVRLLFAAATLTMLHSRFQVQKFKVVPGDFSERGGELTATLKLKRKPTEEKYKGIIDSMYE